MDEPIEVVGAAIVLGGRVLAARKAAGPLRGMWEFPGGKVEAGETHAAALIREIQEELGCEVSPTDRLAVTEHRYEHTWIRLTTLLCTLSQGVPTPIEHAEVRWLTQAELCDVGWAPADQPAAAAVRARL